MKALPVIYSMLYLGLAQRFLDSETASNTELTTFKVLAAIHLIFIGTIIFQPILKKLRKH